MKKLLIGLAALAVVAVGMLVFVWSNLDGIVKKSIQSFGSDATKTEVSVADVKLKLDAGQATITGLTVGNPAGFTDPNIFELTDIGKKSGGASAAEVAQLLSSRLLGNVKGSVASLGVGKYLGKSADMFKNGTTGAVGSAVGGAAGAASGAVKGLFGK